MNIKVKFVDKNGVEGVLPDMSYERFLDSDEYKKYSTSDTPYDDYLKNNNMIDLTDYNSETTSDIELVVEQKNRGRVIKFKCVYNSDEDENFSE